MTQSILRSTLFWVLFILLLVGAGFLSNSFLPPALSKVGYGVLGSIAVLAVTWAFLRVEKKSFHEVGLMWERRTLVRFLLGLLVGSVIFGFILLPLIIFTDIQFESNPEVFTLMAIVAYLGFIPLAFMEEAGFRAYTFLKLNKTAGLLATQFIVAIAFALYHVAYGWSIQAAFLGTFVWAWVFGLAAVWSGGIALPTGLHVAVNALQALLGMKKGYQSVWTISFKDPSQQNIIDAADRVGMIMQLILLIATVALTFYYIKKHRASKTSG